ncbi:hypothetical protein [Gelidibacter japonicus]|uniref:hypothetical protein n=1 Tax=Gelidibacter japonicus TaxID=1962232 RepID=UPI0013D2DFF5|nr:hypothetical protein [Gelidibacter japonicus]
MKKLYSFLFLVLSWSAVGTAQMVITEQEDLVSSGAFTDMVSKNFNYLILGENSPQQGGSLTLNETKTNLKLNGLLWSGTYNILTLETDFGASEGFYFFDEEKGSKTSKVGVNWFTQINSWSSYRTPNKQNQEYTLLKISDLISLQISTYKELKKILTDKVYLDSELITKVEDKINKLKTQYHIDNEATHIVDLASYKKNPTNLVTITYKDEDQKTVIKTISDPTYNIALVFEDYLKKTEYILKTLEKDVQAIENEKSMDSWMGHHVVFLGFKGFYKRESFRTFAYDSTKVFDKMFDDIRGDVYGLDFSFNYHYKKGESGWWGWPKTFFGRGVISGHRASNITDFKSKKINLSTPLGMDNSGNPIITTSDDNAFIGQNSYAYGFSTAIDFDIYYFPIEFPIGLFAEVRYEYINYSSSKDIDDKELSPLRVGFLYNLKNKEKDKPFLTVTLFMDRTDLSLSPNGVDNDLRFGLGVGLPVNLR